VKLWQLTVMSNSDKPTRREFLVTSSSVALGAAIPVSTAQTAPTAESTEHQQASSYSAEELLRPGPQRRRPGAVRQRRARLAGGPVSRPTWETALLA